MAGRRAKRAVKKTVSSTEKNSVAVDAKECQVQDKEASLLHQEVERESVAVRAICDMEIKHTLTGLHLIRSFFNEEQLQSNALEFFNEVFPNLSIVRNEENAQFEVQWKGRDCDISMDEVDPHSSLLRRLSMAYPYRSAVPSFGGYELSSKAGRTSFLGGDNLQMRDYVFEEPSDSQMLGMYDGLQTPGATSQRLSVGMTPKSRRLPKPGEMLLSVHGSPLGVYKEDTMEAINESEEG